MDVARCILSTLRDVLSSFDAGVFFHITLFLRLPVSYHAVYVHCVFFMMREVFRFCVTFCRAQSKRFTFAAVPPCRSNNYS